MTVIKQLLWEYDKISDVHYARTPFGIYQIFSVYDSYAVEFHYGGVLNYIRKLNYKKGLTDIQKAKDMCQQDFENLIKQCLE